MNSPFLRACQIISAVVATISTVIWILYPTLIIEGLVQWNFHLWISAVSCVLSVLGWYFRGTFDEMADPTEERYVLVSRIGNTMMSETFDTLTEARENMHKEFLLECSERKYGASDIADHTGFFEWNAWVDSESKEDFAEWIIVRA